MQKFDLIEIVKTDNDLKQKGINVGCKGAIIECKKNTIFVMFFNDKNFGDYAFADIYYDTARVVGKLPETIYPELENFLSKKEIYNHEYFDTPSIKEYDKVELIVDKEKYKKLGVFKGDQGCVISPYAIQNEIEVDFTKIDKTGNIVGDIIVVDVKEVKVINFKNC